LSQTIYVYVPLLVTRRLQVEDSSVFVDVGLWMWSPCDAFVNYACWTVRLPTYLLTYLPLNLDVKISMIIISTK